MESSNGPTVSVKGRERCTAQGCRRRAKLASLCATHCRLALVPAPPTPTTPLVIAAPRLLERLRKRVQECECSGWEPIPEPRCDRCIVDNMVIALAEGRP